MDDFLELYNKACWDNETHKHLFWSGIDNILGQLLLLKEHHRPFAEFIDYTLWLFRSSLIVRVVEDNNIISNSPACSLDSSKLSALFRQDSLS